MRQHVLLQSIGPEIDEVVFSPEILKHCLHPRYHEKVLSIE